MKRQNGLLFASAVLLLGCVTTQTQPTPGFIEDMIEQIESASLAESPVSIWRYGYRGGEVYYVPFAVACCDRLSLVYDSAGTIVCSPEGGFTGRGDGRCTDFIVRRTEPLLVWSDHRIER